MTETASSSFRAVHPLAEGVYDWGRKRGICMNLSFWRRKRQVPAPSAVLPKHVAFIMDGNGRWARRRGLPRTAGHVRGLDILRSIVQICSGWGIPYATFYAFSTENWNRSADEVEFLMDLFVSRMPGLARELSEYGVRVRFIGVRDGLAPAVRACMDDAEAVASEGKMTVFIAFNYGGRSEIVEAVKSIASDVQAGKCRPSEITEAMLGTRIGNVPDPDLLIRTGGELRLSNFLLWQCAYSELYFTRTLWPDFGSEEIRTAMMDFARRERRYGGVRV